MRGSSGEKVPILHERTIDAMNQSMERSVTTKTFDTVHWVYWRESNVGADRPSLHVPIRSALLAVSLIEVEPARLGQVFQIKCFASTMHTHGFIRGRNPALVEGAGFIDQLGTRFGDFLLSLPMLDNFAISLATLWGNVYRENRCTCSPKCTHIYSRLCSHFHFLKDQNARL